MLRKTAEISSLAGLLLLLSTAALGIEKRPATAKDQLSFGVKMAERGLWSEALFRFEQAQRLDPQNPSVHNNLAVANEALGLFEEALSHYRAALELDPANKILRRNYARFVEFYQSFKPPEEEGEEGEQAESGEGKSEDDREPGGAGDTP